MSPNRKPEESRGGGDPDYLDKMHAGVYRMNAPDRERAGQMMDRAAAFGDVVRKARLARDLTQEELAERTKGLVSRRTIIRWENGRVMHPDQAQMDRIAVVLDIPIADLYIALGWLEKQGEHEESTVDQWLEALKQHLEHASDAERLEWAAKILNELTRHDSE